MTKTDRFDDRITIAVIIAIIAAVLLLLPSCYTQRTAERQLDRAHHKYPDVPAKYCAEHFDPVDSTSTVIEYIQGDTLVFTDTLTDTTYLDRAIYLTKTVTNTRIVHDTVKTKEYVKTENKAAIRLLTKTTIQQADKIHNRTIENWFWRCLFGLVVVYKIVRTWLGRKAKIVKDSTGI